MYGTELALTTLPARKPHFPEIQDDKVKSLFFPYCGMVPKGKIDTRAQTIHGNARHVHLAARDPASQRPSSCGLVVLSERSH